jgi:hypothetical protein
VWDARHEDAKETDMATETYARGEYQGPGGSMPDAVVELRTQAGRVEATILLAKHRCLGHTIDDGQRRPIEPGDVFHLGHADEGSPPELLRRRFGAEEWRLVTSEHPWWHGREYVAPVQV